MVGDTNTSGSVRSPRRKSRLDREMIFENSKIVALGHDVSGS